MDLRHYLQSDDTLRQRAQRGCVLFLGIVLSVIVTPAAAQIESSTPVTLLQDMVLVLDNSGSMRHNDPRFLAKEAADRGLVLTLGDVLFAYDRASLKSGAQQNLYRLVTFLKEHPEQTVLIEGHTDTEGSESYNLELSERRAEAVQDFLISNGIGPEQITARGYGEAYPLASNDTLAGRQQNRRVEVIFPSSSEHPSKRVPQLARLSPRTPVADPAPSNPPPADPPKAGGEKASTPPGHAFPRREAEPRADTSATAPLVVPSQPPSRVEAQEDPLRYRLVVVAALLMAAMLALVAVLLWYRERRAKSDTHTPTPMAYLFDLSGVTGRERHELGAVTVVGRVPASERNHIVINRPTIGRVHAVIERKHHGFWLIDQNSKNGTYVNGCPATSPMCLTHGDRVQFHDFDFEFDLAGMNLADATVVAGGGLALLRETGARATWAVAEEMGLDKCDRFSDSLPGNQTTNPATTAKRPQDRTSSRGDGESKPDPDDAEYGHHQRRLALLAIDDTLPNERTVQTFRDNDFKP